MVEWVRSGDARQPRGRRALLGEIVEQIARHRSDIEVVRPPVPEAELSREVARQRPHVVILGIEDGELPKSCRDLLHAFPGVVVVGVAADGKRIAFCAEDMGPDEFVGTLRSAVSMEARLPQVGG